MMIALLSPTIGGGVATPAWLPSGATAFLDFVNGNYYAGGQARDIADLLGGGFNPAAISGAGMFFVFENGNVPNAAGAFLDDIVAQLPSGATFVFDMNFVNLPYGWVMFAGDASTWATSTEDIVIAADDNTYDEHSLGVGTALTGTGVHKLAVTLNRDVGGGDFEYAWCADGGTALTQTVSYGVAWTADTAAIGSDGAGAEQQLDSVYIRSITLYPAKLPTDLPALTA